MESIDALRWGARELYVRGKYMPELRSEPKDNEYLEEARCRHDEFTRVPWAPPTEERVAAVAQLCAIIR